MFLWLKGRFRKTTQHISRQLVTVSRVFLHFDFRSFEYISNLTVTSREMPSNVEIKAKVKDFETFKRKAKEISDSEGKTFALRQAGGQVNLSLEVPVGM